jgi:hypothetical protein
MGVLWPAWEETGVFGPPRGGAVRTCDLSGKSQPPAPSCKSTKTPTPTAAPWASTLKLCLPSLSLPERASLTLLAPAFTAPAEPPVLWDQAGGLTPAWKLGLGSPFLCHPFSAQSRGRSVQPLWIPSTSLPHAGSGPEAAG